MASSTSMITLIPVFLLGIVSTTRGEEQCRITGYINSDVTLSCLTKVIGTDIQISLKLKLCRENPQISAKIDVNKFNIHFEKQGDASISVPIGKIASLKVSIISNAADDQRVDVSMIPLNAISISLFSKKVDLDCSVFWYWINSQSIGVLVGIGVGALLFLICCCYCCCKCCKSCCKCCCGCCRKKQATSEVLAQSGHQMTPSQSNVPYTRTKELDDIA